MNKTIEELKKALDTDVLEYLKHRTAVIGNTLDTIIFAQF